MKIEPKAFLAIERSKATDMRAQWGRLSDQILPSFKTGWRRRIAPGRRRSPIS
jgi:hypothetical protein